MSRPCPIPRICPPIRITTSTHAPDRRLLRIVVARFLRKLDEQGHNASETASDLEIGEFSVLDYLEKLEDDARAQLQRQGSRQ